VTTLSSTNFQSPRKGLDYTITSTMINEATAGAVGTRNTAYLCSSSLLRLWLYERCGAQMCSRSHDDMNTLHDPSRVSSLFLDTLNDLVLFRFPSSPSPHSPLPCGTLFESLCLSFSFLFPPIPLYLFVSGVTVVSRVPLHTSLLLASCLLVLMTRHLLSQY
jgi:hypothetical protein